VQSGRVNFAVGDETTEIVTPTVKTTALQNATGNIDVGSSGETGVKIFRGQAEVETTQGQRITLTENTAVQVDAAGKAGSKLELPPPPRSSPPLRGPAAARGPAGCLGDALVERGEERHHLPRGHGLQRDAGEPAPLGRLDEPGITATTHDLKGLNLGATSGGSPP